MVKAHREAELAISCLAVWPVHYHHSIHLHVEWRQGEAGQSTDYGANQQRSTADVAITTQQLGTAKPAPDLTFFIETRNLQLHANTGSR